MSYSNITGYKKINISCKMKKDNWCIIHYSNTNKVFKKYSGINIYKFQIEKNNTKDVTNIEVYFFDEKKAKNLSELYHVDLGSVDNNGLLDISGKIYFFGLTFNMDDKESLNQIIKKIYEMENFDGRTVRNIEKFLDIKI